jgi:hypothetical protein
VVKEYCETCGKRIWFWQKRFWENLGKENEKPVHIKCYNPEVESELLIKSFTQELSKEEVETPMEEITGATIDSTTGEKNSSLQETSCGDEEEFNKECEEGYENELKEDGCYLHEELSHEEIKKLNEKEKER